MADSVRIFLHDLVRVRLLGLLLPPWEHPPSRGIAFLLFQCRFWELIKVEGISLVQVL